MRDHADAGRPHAGRSQDRGPSQDRGRSPATRLSRAATRLGCAAALVVAAGCGNGGTQLVETAPVGAGAVIATPANFPAARLPAENLPTTEKIALGRFLFYDRRLSGNGTQSCGSCHRQALAFTDGRGQAIGSTGEIHPRGAQSLANVVYNGTLTWANPALVSLETQMRTPLFGTNPVEMGIDDGNQAQVLDRLRSDPDYPARFRAAFPGSADPIGWNTVIAAIASFQRSLVSGNSRFDRFQRGEVQLTDTENRGRLLFFGEKAECFHCHGSFNFNDQIVHAGSRPGFIETPFHNTGLYNIDGRGGFPAPNRGVFESTFAPNDMGAFRAPSLRNVAVTAPYMHDGTIATLEDVLRFYRDGGRVIPSGPNAGDGRASPLKSGLIAQIALSEAEAADIVAFLKTLTDADFLTDPRHADPFQTTE